MARKPGPSLTREQVIAAALTLVEAEGEAGLGVRRLARALEIQPSSVYHHVRDQGDLRHAVALAGWQQLLQAVAVPPLDLRAVARRYRSFAHAHRELYLLMTSTPWPSQPAEAGAVAEQAIAALGLPAGDHRALRALRGAVHGFVHLELIGQLPSEADAAFEWLVEAVVAGIGQASESPTGR